MFRPGFFFGAGGLRGLLLGPERCGSESALRFPNLGLGLDFGFGFRFGTGGLGNFFFGTGGLGNFFLGTGGLRWFFLGAGRWNSESILRFLTRFAVVVQPCL